MSACLPHQKMHEDRTLEKNLYSTYGKFINTLDTREITGKKWALSSIKGYYRLARGTFLASLLPQLETPGPDSRVILGFCQNGSCSQVLLSLVSLHKSLMTLEVFGMHVTEQSQVPKCVPRSDKFKTEGWYDQQRQYRNAQFSEAGYWQGTMTKF